MSRSPFPVTPPDRPVSLMTTQPGHRAAGLHTRQAAAILPFPILVPESRPRCPADVSTEEFTFTLARTFLPQSPSLIFQKVLRLREVP
jgi:hypothetical protein